VTTLVEKGAPIAVIAPSGICDPARLEAGLAIARAAGHDLRPFPGMRQPHRYLSAPDDVRLAQLIEAFRSPDYAAVWLARGGYGLTRLLPLLPDDLPIKPVIGFSDGTALFSALHVRGFPLVHGPVVHSLPITDPASCDALFDVLAGARPPLTGAAWRGGAAAGPVIGGNLAMFAALCGTPWQIDTHGAIVILEDVGEAPYRVDRMLQQLVSAGGLHGAAGVAFGQFTGCAPPADATWTLRDVLLEGIPEGVPVMGDLAVGHGGSNRAFVWGAAASFGSTGVEFTC
jgi:muramoyltetrapeptide carboxypeptidase